MGDNPGPTLIRALHLPLRDVHDLCATGDVDYLIAFARDEEHRAQNGLGRPHSASRKATSPVRRAEYLQGSKLAEKQQKEKEEREMAARARKKELNKRKRQAEAEAAAKAEAGGYDDDGGADSQVSGDDGAAGDRYNNNAAAAAGDEDEEYDEAAAANNASGHGNADLLVSVGAGSTDQDRVPVDQVFPRPRLGKTAFAASEDANFNTVGLAVTSVYDLVNFKDEHGLLPIHTACVFGTSRVIDFLMEHGADIECEAPGTRARPLHLAVANGHEALARRLVEVYGADPGALTADFELPLTIARRRRAAELEIFLQQCCRERIKSTNALSAAFDGEVLFFAFHSQCDEDGGKKCFTADYLGDRRTDKAPTPTSSTGVSVDALIRDAVSTPLDVAIGSMNKNNTKNSNEESYKMIAEILLRGGYYELNELRESPICTTTLYLAVSVPTRDGVNLLVQHGADPRVASVFNAAPNQILKLRLAEAEAKVVFEEFFKTKDDIAFEERAEFVQTVTGLRDKWRKAKKALEKALNREEAIAAAEGSS